MGDETAARRPRKTVAGSDAKRRVVYDADAKSLVVAITQGEFYVTASPREVITTLLGSCIAVCMHDPVTGWGGMNHFLLPDDLEDGTVQPKAGLRYGIYSIERLTNALIAKGVERSRIEVKLFGGANILNNGNLGHTNAAFVEDYMQKERLKVVASSLYGSRPRRVRFHPASGRAMVREGSGLAATQLLANEPALSKAITKKHCETKVELFAPRPRIAKGTRGDGR